MTKTETHLSPASSGALLDFHQSTRPEVSVVVPVRNRSDQLRDLLEALLRQTYSRDRFEVLVCDDGSTENLAEIIANAAAAGLQVTHLLQSPRGAASARNLGISHARSDLLVFIDSDCLPDPGWLAAFGTVFTDPEVTLAGGAIGYRNTRSLSGRCLNFLMSSSLGAAGARDPRGLIRMKYYPRAGNMAVRRQVAKAVSGFPIERYGEDIEFSHRVLCIGGAVRFVPDAAVTHDERRTIGQAAREAYHKGRARVRLARRCGMHQVVHALPALLLLYLLFLPGVLICWPGAVMGVIVPLVLYACALIMLAWQGMWDLADLRAVAVIPAMAITIHLGYGVGYLVARTRWRVQTLTAVRRRGTPIDY